MDMSWVRRRGRGTDGPSVKVPWAMRSGESGSKLSMVCRGVSKFDLFVVVVWMSKVVASCFEVHVPSFYFR